MIISMDIKSIRITYISANHEYTEIFEIMDEGEIEYFVDYLGEGCFEEKDEKFKGLFEGIMQSDYCPSIFMEEPILRICVKISS